MFEWLLGGKLTKDRLNGFKKIKVNGMNFVIRRVNPLLDLPADKIPQFFTDYPFQQQAKDPLYLKRSLDNMMIYIEAGVVSPELAPIGKGDKNGKENGITAEDLFRDPEIGTKLYMAIMDHSLNKYRGLKGLFFSIKRKLWSFIIWHLSMESFRRISSLEMMK